VTGICSLSKRTLLSQAACPMMSVNQLQTEKLTDQVHGSYVKQLPHTNVRKQNNRKLFLRLITYNINVRTGDVAPHILGLDGTGTKMISFTRQPLYVWQKTTALRVIISQTGWAP
jgi:hypothetical protein